MVKSWLPVDWPAPNRVKAIYTLRQGGSSLPPYDSFNLGLHVADNPQAVLANRAKLKASASLPAEPCWLDQVHGTDVYKLASASPLQPPQADASVTETPNLPLAILTADCLPILLCDRSGAWVAAIHAGWRSLAAGIIEQTLAEYSGACSDLIAWLGPAISREAFEVGSEVRDIFVAADPHAGNAFHLTAKADKFLADLPLLATQRLNTLGVIDVTNSAICTFNNAEHFYSFRRDGETGRMATLIWLTN